MANEMKYQKVPVIEGLSKTKEMKYELSNIPPTPPSLPPRAPHQTEMEKSLNALLLIWNIVQWLKSNFACLLINLSYQDTSFVFLNQFPCTL